jgi:hypothetical protein
MPRYLTVLTKAGKKRIDLTELPKDVLRRLKIDEYPAARDPFARFAPHIPGPISSGPMVSRSHPFVYPRQFAELRAQAIAEKNRMLAAKLFGIADAGAKQPPPATPQTNGPDDPAEMPGLTSQLYNYYLIPFGGGKDPQHPVEIRDWHGELKDALASQVDRWYQSQIAELGLGSHFFDTNAAATAPWYTGHSDYSGLGLLAHSSNVHALGSFVIAISRMPEGFQKVASFDTVYWTWNDEIHGMDAKEWERRYPGSKAWQSPEVWLHEAADWYGAYYVAIHWDDTDVLYKGDVYGGQDGYEGALNGGVSRVQDDREVGAPSGGPKPHLMP